MDDALYFYLASILLCVLSSEICILIILGWHSFKKWYKENHNG